MVNTTNDISFNPLADLKELRRRDYMNALVNKSSPCRPYPHDTIYWFEIG
jgi:hypothetical protein